MPLCKHTQDDSFKLPYLLTEMLHSLFFYVCVFMCFFTVSNTIERAPILKLSWETFLSYSYNAYATPLYEKSWIRPCKGIKLCYAHWLFVNSCVDFNSFIPNKDPWVKLAPSYWSWGEPYRLGGPWKQH